MNGVPLAQAILPAAIAAALVKQVSPPPEVSAADLAEDGREAMEIIQHVMTSMSDLISGQHQERSFLALQLIRSSCEHGRACCYLLASNPIDMAAVALSLSRSQLEQFLRAVFVARLADNDQLEDFMNADEGPRRKTEKGKWQKIPMAELGAMVDQSLAEIGGEAADGKLARMVQNTWEPLCGLVHGGRSLRAMYQDRDGQVGCDVPADIQFQLTINSVATVNYCLILASALSDLPDDQQNALLNSPMQEFYGYVGRRNERLRRLGMVDQIVELLPRPSS